MQKALILGGLRSFIGVSGGVYKHLPAELLGAAVLKKVMEKYHVQQPDYLIGGNAVGAGGNITRLLALEAGVAASVPALTVDVQCGSSLECLALAAAKIVAGEAEVIIAGGFESGSCQPRRALNPNHPDYQNDNFYNVAKFMPGEQRETAMLEGAELTAAREQITKEEMDVWVLRSHRLALEARARGFLQDVTTAVQAAHEDEGIRPRMSQRLLDRLPKLLAGGQFLTAANACLINDGAAFLVLCSEKFATSHKLQAEARIIGSVACGGDPLLSPKTAVLALEKLLARYGLKEQDIAAFEVNEAFAVIDVLFVRSFSQSLEKYNIFGGALAYGHPYGASGAIITLHLLQALQQKRGRYGCAAIAAAGGVGTALLLEKI